MNVNLLNIKNNININIVSKEKISYLEENKKIYIVQKFFIDTLVSILLLVATSPFWLYSIYRIKKESPGPIFFKQSRVGENGKSFMCYKFRSMHVNSAFNPYTQDQDVRIFPYGSFMRKYRIDELPQILNILKQDMHLVGPRAEWDILVDQYELKINNYQKRHIIKPGITGLAQVCYPYGRNTRDAHNKLKYDLFYIRNWSFFLELKVILKTVMVVIGKKGV